MTAKVSTTSLNASAKGLTGEGQGLLCLDDSSHTESVPAWVGDNCLEKLA